MRLLSVSWTVAQTEAGTFALRCRWGRAVLHRCYNRNRRGSYDAIGEKFSETWVGGNYTANYQYNAAGELTQASDPFSSYAFIASA
jgi:hypothetical protein